MISNIIQQQFDGIKFLWRISNTRSILVLIGVFFILLISAYLILNVLVLVSGTPIVVNDSTIDSSHIFLFRLTYYLDFFFYAGFFFILIEIFRFYQREPSSAKDSASRNFLHISAIIYKNKRIPVIVIGALGVLLLIVITEISFILSPIEINLFIIIALSINLVTYILDLGLFFLLIVTAFITSKGAMESFIRRYSEKIQSKPWVFIMFPLTWISFIIVFFGVLIFDFIGEDSIAYWSMSGWWIALTDVLGVLSLISIPAILIPKWRSNYPVILIAAFLTFVLVIIGPGIIGLGFDYLGTSISFCMLVILFIFGVLDEFGDNLRETIIKSDSQIQWVNLKATHVISYRTLILGLCIPLFTFFEFILGLGSGFAKLDDMSEKLRFLNSSTAILFDFELIGLSLGVIITTIFILFRQKKKPEMSTFITRQEKYSRQIYSTCPACNAPLTAGYIFCVHCGQKL